MRDVLLSDALVLDEPGISLAWTSTFDDATAMLAGRGCDPALRRCVLRDVVFAGVAFARATFSFDARGCLAHARFERGGDVDGWLKDEVEVTRAD